MKNYKTFKDLKFEPHGISYDAQLASPFLRDYYGGAKQAVVEFKNGYGVSVLLGRCFKSNGADTYELGVLYDGGLTFKTDITDDVLGHLTEEGVTEVMIKVQDFDNGEEKRQKVLT